MSRDGCLRDFFFFLIYPKVGTPQPLWASFCSGPRVRCGLTSSYLWSERMLPTFRYSTVPTTKTEESSVSARHRRKGKKKRGLRQSGCRLSPHLTPFCPPEPTRKAHGAWQRRGWIQICASFFPCPLTEREMCAPEGVSRVQDWTSHGGFCRGTAIASITAVRCRCYCHHIGSPSDRREERAPLG